MYRIYYVEAEVMRLILSSMGSLPEVKPRLNFPKEDKPHNLRVDVVDPASTVRKCQYAHCVCMNTGNGDKLKLEAY